MSTDSRQEYGVEWTSGELVMPTCPSCKKVIDSLDYHALEDSGTYSLYIDEGRVVVKYEDGLEGLSMRLFLCPECKNLLFTNYDDAVKFLLKTR